MEKRMIENEKQPKPCNKAVLAALITAIVLLQGLVSYDYLTGGGLAYANWSGKWRAEASHQLPESGIESRNNGADFGLDPAQETLILEYMTRYYDGVSTLTEPDLRGLYLSTDPGAGLEAEIDQTTAAYLVALRALQPQNLHMNRYQVGVTYTSAAQTENGDTRIELLEDSTVNFACTPNTDASTSGIAHVFTLRPTNDGWKILHHDKEEDGYLLIREAYDKQKAETPMTDAAQSLASIKAGLLERATAAIADQNNQRAGVKSSPTSTKTAAHPYDRDAAVAYAMDWVSPQDVKRNPDWYVYDGYGGNCNNFISQCIIAGGIPMDITGDDQWKWYDDEVDYWEAPVGRSPAWAGVAEFHQYAENNVGPGMAADVNLNRFVGEPGDIIQFGAEGEWRHSVIITEVLLDDAGTPVDYLINSNTADRINYPVSAYAYYDYRMIKVLGWND